MAKTINTMTEFQEYIAGVFSRIDHHAGRVKITCAILAGRVAMAATPGTIAVRTYSGKTTNVIWFSHNCDRYCLTYNHGKECVELCRDNLAGEIILSINDDDLGWVDQLFELLKVKV